MRGLVRVLICSDAVNRDCVRETIFCETPDAKTDRIQDATVSIYSGEERAGTGRAAGFRGPAREPVGVRTAKPLISWFLPGDIRMLAGEARHIASDRAGFLGSHPRGKPPENGRESTIKQVLGWWTPGWIPLDS